MKTNFEDVGDFHRKFGLPTYGTIAPSPLDKDLLAFRGGFLLEELAEFFEASGALSVSMELKRIRERVSVGEFATSPMLALKGLANAIDALVDLNYVSLGTAHFMGCPYDDHWGEVQRANMGKERAKGESDPRSKRRHSSDVVKPFGWHPPVHEPFIEIARRSYGATLVAKKDGPSEEEQAGWA